MAKTKSSPQPGGVPVTVAAALKDAQDCLIKAKALLPSDPVQAEKLTAAAETVVSSLILVLKQRHAVLPEAVRPHLELIEKEMT